MYRLLLQSLMQAMMKESKAYLVVCSYPQTEENYVHQDELLINVYVRELLKLATNPLHSKGKGK